MLDTPLDEVYSVQTETIDNGPGRFKHQRVKIFQGSDQIGEYVRNYPGFGESTFCPFRLDDRDLALYSPNYTATRIMSLPDCTDLGGDEPSGGGFCPAEYYAPHYRLVQSKTRPGQSLRVHPPFGPGIEKSPYKIAYHRFAFLAGCVWGDDSSWKITLLDLSEAHLGKITYDRRFGHMELGYGISLKQAIELSDFDGDFIRISTARDYRFSTGHPANLSEEWDDACEERIYEGTIGEAAADPGATPDSNSA